MFLKYYSHISGGAQDLPQPLCPAVSVRHGTNLSPCTLMILLSKVVFKKTEGKRKGKGMK